MSENAKMSNNSHAGKTDTPQKKILIVEDEPHALATLLDRLQFEGYKIITAEDGEAALAKARGESPDLIILDVMLPKMDGRKVCRLLKFDEKLRYMPIIMLSARTQQSDIELGKEVGADAYITKPFDMKVLLAKIRELMLP